MTTPLIQDEALHTYTFPLAEQPRWRGPIKQLRLDPCRSTGKRVKIDDVRLVAERPETE